MTNLINMTPHEINVVLADGTPVLTIPASGNLIRLDSQVVNTGVTINGVPLTKTVFGEPVGLPEFQEGVFYIVSQLVKSALPDRTDLLVPAEMVRVDGKIVGCQSFGI